MATYVELPQMTDTMTEGVISAWLKEEGDDVLQGDPIAEIETDKAVMELEAPEDGVLLRRYVEEQEEVPCGTIVAVVGTAGEAVDDAPEAATQPAAGAADEPVAETETATPEPKTSAAQPVAERIKASPVARRTAGEAGINLASVTGTGPDGRIVKRDIEARLGGGETSTAGDAVPVGRKRRIMIERLVETHQTVPSFTVTRHFDCDRLAQFRDELKRTDTFADGVGYTELVVKAAAIAMQREPRLNARYETGGIRSLAEVNVGVAVGLDDGVIVPVIRGCERKSLREIAEEFRAATDRARNGTLLADELGGSTFTVSNLGMYGVDEFAAVINAPDAAILALGAVKDRPVVRDGEIVAGKVMTGTLTVDHRVADGVTAARWLAELAAILGNPVSLIA